MGLSQLSGLYRFPKDFLPIWRESVLHAKHGAKLARIVKALRKDDIEVGGEQYARTPRGCPKNHERDDLLRHKGIYAGIRFEEHPDALFDPERCLPWLTQHYAAMAPLHTSLAAARERQTAAARRRR